jgi:hypothetical protein
MDKNPSKILPLSLITEAFVVMITGEKQIEYRDIKQWVNSRLLNKDGTPKKIGYIKFFNGRCVKDSPYFICEYKGATKVKNVHKKYSTGFEVNFDGEKWAIQLGKIIERG